ncbi:MAG: hypothetical protein FWH19_00435 [Treponema sp.]|nr:hypothetical protein [Treponema sp.]
MTRGILLVGSESSLLSAIAAEAAKRVESFALAMVPSRLPLSERGQITTARSRAEAGEIFIPWNPFSSISARTLVLAAESRLNQINDAILIYTPPALFKDIEALTPEEIDILVNDHIRGWFFLIRELALYFQRAPSGCLSFVAPESAAGRKAQLDILGSSALASFRTFAQGILAQSAISSPLGRSFLTMGFTASGSCSEEEFALWLFKIIDESSKKNSGRWHKYSKINFFR